jgi:trimeric autotransporter adhesin
VGSAQVIDNSLTASDLAPGSVRTSEVADNSLTAADLAPNSVMASEIATGAVGSNEIADGSVGPAHLAEDYVKTTGDATTGDLSIDGDITVLISSVATSDYAATLSR